MLGASFTCNGSDTHTNHFCLRHVETAANPASNSNVLVTVSQKHGCNAHVVMNAC